MDPDERADLLEELDGLKQLQAVALPPGAAGAWISNSCETRIDEIERALAQDDEER